MPYCFPPVPALFFINYTVLVNLGGHGLAAAFDPHDRCSSSTLKPNWTAGETFTYLFSNILSAEPFGLSARLTAGSER
jgi:hypothetical protein